MFLSQKRPTFCSVSHDNHRVHITAAPFDMRPYTGTKVLLNDRVCKNDYEVNKVYELDSSYGFYKPMVYKKIIIALPV